jgi:hypothetical protein
VTPIPGQSSTVGDDVSVPVKATDPDGDTLVYSASGLPGGVTIDIATGAISGKLTTAGDFNVVVHVSDGKTAVHAPFQWHVAAAPVNRAPVVAAIADRDNHVGDVITLPVQAGDADGDALQYSATGLPGGLAMNPLTGAITGTLTTAGDFNVTVKASDGQTSGQAAFVWRVAPRLIQQLVNPGPQVNRDRDRVFLTMRVVLNPALPVPPPGTIQFSAKNLPPGLQISPSTGVISGQIARGSVGVYTTTVTVTENGTRPLSQTFTWTVRSRSGNSGNSSRASAQILNWAASLWLPPNRK